MSSFDFDFLYMMACKKNTRHEFHSLIDIFYACRKDPKMEICSFKNMTQKIDSISPGMSSTKSARNIIHNIVS